MVISLNALGNYFWDIIEVHFFDLKGLSMSLYMKQSIEAIFRPLFVAYPKFPVFRNSGVQVRLNLTDCMCYVDFEGFCG